MRESPRPFRKAAAAIALLAVAAGFPLRPCGELAAVQSPCASMPCCRPATSPAPAVKAPSCCLPAPGAPESPTFLRPAPERAPDRHDLRAPDAPPAPFGAPDGPRVARLPGGATDGSPPFLLPPGTPVLRI